MRLLLLKIITPLALMASITPIFAGSAADDIKVIDPWAREIPPVTSTSAGFLALENTGDSAHKLVAATSENVSMIELHTHINDNGIMRMRQVEDILIPAKTMIKLEPSGLHLMLMMIKEPLKAGEMLSITLQFEDGSSKDIQAEILNFAMRSKKLY